MRFFRPLSLLLLWSLMFCSCNKSDDYVYPEVVSEIMTMVRTGKEMQVRQDNTDKLFTNTNTVYFSSQFAVGDRVYVTRTVNESSLPDGVWGVEFYECQKVLTKKVTAVAKAVLDTLANDPLKVESVWRSAHYINTRVAFDYYNTPHQLGLYCNSDASTPDTLRLELRHGLNGDRPGTQARSYASFSIDSLLSIHPSAVVTVRINSTNYGNKELAIQ